MIAHSEQISPSKEKLTADLSSYKRNERKLSVKEIASGLRSGNESILGYVYSKYVHDLFRFGNQIVKDQEIVKDCIQDVFAGLVKNKKSLDGVHSIKSYLFKALYREIIDKSKKDRRYFLGHPLLDNLDGFEIDLSYESRMIDDDNHQAKLKKVNDELTKLSKKQKQAILLYYYEGMTQGEVADIMSLKDKNSVTKLIRRGLDSLRKVLPTIIILFLYS